MPDTDLGSTGERSLSTRLGKLGHCSKAALGFGIAACPLSCLERWGKPDSPAAAKPPGLDGTRVKPALLKSLQLAGRLEEERGRWVAAQICQVGERRSQSNHSPIRKSPSEL